MKISIFRNLTCLIFFLCLIIAALHFLGNPFRHCSLWIEHRIQVIDDNILILKNSILFPLRNWNVSRGQFNFACISWHCLQKSNRIQFVTQIIMPICPNHNKISIKVRMIEGFLIEKFRIFQNSLRNLFPRNSVPQIFRGGWFTNLILICSAGCQTKHDHQNNQRKQLFLHKNLLIANQFM